MGKKVSQRMRYELVAAVIERCQRGGRDDKTRILNEFARITGYHRKHVAYVGHRGHSVRCIVITGVGDLSRSEAT